LRGKSSSGLCPSPRHAEHVQHKTPLARTSKTCSWPRPMHPLVPDLKMKPQIAFASQPVRRHETSSLRAGLAQFIHRPTYMLANRRRQLAQAAVAPPALRRPPSPGETPPCGFHRRGLLFYVSAWPTCTFSANQPTDPQPFPAENWHSTIPFHQIIIRR